MDTGIENRGAIKGRVCDRSSRFDSWQALQVNDKVELQLLASAAYFWMRAKMDKN